MDALYLLQRSTKRKKTVHNYSYIAKGIRDSIKGKKGKRRHEIITKLGKLSSEQAISIRAALRVFNRGDQIAFTVDELQYKRSLSFLDIMVYRKIWKKWQFDKVFKDESKAAVPLSVLAMLMTIHRCCDPGSRLHLERWYSRTILPQLLGISGEKIYSKRLYRAMTDIEVKHTAIEDFIYEQIKARDNESLTIIFYDISSTYFEGDQVVLGERNAKSKDGKVDKKQILLGIMIDNVGRPIAWDIYPGADSENPKLIIQAKILKSRFHLKDVHLVFDRGFIGRETFSEIKKADCFYVTAEKKDKLPLLANGLMKQLKGVALENLDILLSEIEDFKRYDEDTYYHDSGNINGHRTIITFNKAHFKRSRAKRREKIMQLKKWVEDQNSKLLDWKKDASREAISKDVDTEIKRLKLESYVRYELHEKKLDQTIQTPTKNRYYQRKILSLQIELFANEEDPGDGFYILTASTNSDLTSEQIIAVYYQKHVIENAFHIMKTFIKIHPTNVYTETHVRAHYTICVLAYFLMVEIRNCFQNRRLPSEDYITLERFKEEFADVTVSMNSIGNFIVYKKATLNTTVKRMLDLLNMTTLPLTKIK